MPQKISKFVYLSLKKIIIKLGTGILSEGQGEIRTDRMEQLAEAIASLAQEQIQTIIVSSGAVGLGMGKLGINERPKNMALLRACASIGQCRLMNAWSNSLEKFSLIASQVLLTREDIENKIISQKVEETLSSLLDQKVIPIVNENDSVRTKRSNLVIMMFFLRCLHRLAKRIF